MAQHVQEMVSREVARSVDRLVREAMDSYKAEILAEVRKMIDAQIAEQKEQIDRELTKDFRKLRATCKKDAAVARELALVPVAAGANGDAASTGAGALTTLNAGHVADIARETALVAVKGACTEMVKRITDTVNTNVSSQLSEMIKYVDAKTQDGQETVDKFRLAVEQQHEGSAGSRQVGTSGFVRLVL